MFMLQKRDSIISRRTLDQDGNKTGCSTTTNAHNYWNFRVHGIICRMNSDFYKNYNDEYFRLIYSDDLDEIFDDFKKLAESVKSNKHKLIFAGNGASASISAHALKLCSVL